MKLSVHQSFIRSDVCLENFRYRVVSFNWGVDKKFVVETKAKLDTKAMARSALESDEGYQLRESQSP